MATVILVRHGRTAANVNGILAGWTPGVTLDETGREQAEGLAKRLAGVTLDAIITSPLERARETAAPLLAERPRTPLHVDERVGECRYGDWSGRPLKELSREPLWKVVQGQASGAIFPEGESMVAMQARAVEAVRHWNAELGDRAVYVVVSHGDVIKAILADALGMHLDQFQRIVVDPASVSVVSYSAVRPFVIRTNDTGGSLAFLSRSRKRRRSSDAAVGGGAGDA